MADEENVEIISVECLRVKAKELSPEKIVEKVEERTMDSSTKAVLKNAMMQNIETV